ncbi:MAG: hypothetical protein ACO3C1_08105 [Ilumatobacteraceae bacterium]
MTTNDNDAAAPGGGAPSPRRPDPVGELEQAGRVLDAPLLGGDVPPLAPVPQVKPLVWEHVVRPLDGTPAGGLPRVPPAAPAPQGDPLPASPAAAPANDPSPVAHMPSLPLDIVAASSLAAGGVASAEDHLDVVDARTKDHVTAELDRLAFAPEDPSTAADGATVAAPSGATGEILIVEATPTTPLPTTTSGPVPAVSPTGAPSLPPSNVDPVRPQSAPPPAPAESSPATAAVGAAAVSARRSYADLVGTARPAAPRRRKRRVFRRLFSMALVLGLIGGGLVAARHYLIDPQWADDIAPLAAEVAEARSLEFTATVPVIEQTPTVYSIMLADSVLGLSEAVIDDTAGEWRAMGLLNGVIDSAAIGRTAIPDQPAFYDPTTASIQVVNGLPPELRAFALQRALTMALLDQHYAWSVAISGQSVAVSTGTRMLYEADALATALSLVTESERQAIGTEMTEQFTRLEVPSSPSPYATTLLSRLGVAMWPWFRELPEGDRTSLVMGARLADASLLDLRRFVVAAPAAGAAPVTTLAGRPVSATEPVPAGTRGMLYWYHVLASRVDPDLAWRAALSWQADELTAERTAGRVCVSAVFETDVAGGEFARMAFEQWSATSPSPATVLVTDRAVDPSTGAPTGLQIAVDVCDPGPTVDSNDGRSRLALGGAPLRTEQFVRLLEQSPDLTREQAACLVYGIDPVSVSDERGVIDGLDGWTAIEAHPAIDATLPCPVIDPSVTPTTTAP